MKKDTLSASCIWKKDDRSDEELQEEEDRGLDERVGAALRCVWGGGGGLRPSGAYGAGCALPDEGPEAGERGLASKQTGLEVELARAIELLQPSERYYSYS
jgi:hypothetical protein